MSIETAIKEAEARLEHLKSIDAQKRIAPHEHLMARTERPRAHGYLIITEYNNMGDLSPGSPQEPPIKRHDVELHGVSEPLTENTRLMALWATHGGEFATFCCAKWSPGDPLPDDIHWVPIAPKYEILRIAHMPANLRIAYR
jgi:hypothetical protein